MEHKINELNNFIAGWYIQDQSLCQDIITYFENKQQKHQGTCGEIVDVNFKNSIDSALDDSKLLNRYANELGKIVGKYKEKYSFCSEGVHFTWSVTELPNIQCYHPPSGGFPRWHCERAALVNLKRHLVYMTYLNDVEDGGETEWYYQKLKVKPEKGLTVIWPSDWTFTHRGNISQVQKKYIVTGWYNILS